MSSPYVRSTLKAFLADNNPDNEIYIDLTVEFETLDDVLARYGTNDFSPWVGLEFIGNDEVPVSVPATNTTGKYRESGALEIHIVDVAKLGVGDSILTRGEKLRNLLRGRRIESIVIDSVSPINFGRGAALEFDNGQISGSFLVSYERDNDL